MSRVVLLTSLFAIFASSADGQIATPVISSFDTGLDGWTSNTPSEIVWSPTGGNGGGYARFEETSSAGTYMSAPSDFLGDWSALDDNGSLMFDFKIFEPGLNSIPSIHGVRIFGPNGSASWIDGSHLGQPTGWLTFNAPIRQSDWILQSGTWVGALSDVTELQIFVDVHASPAADEITGVDNVRLVPEPSSSLLMLIAGSLASRRKNGRHRLHSNH